ncbi:helix-turn-helix transcriptional regulator [Amycolatopsis sp. NPDC004368]
MQLPSGLPRWRRVADLVGRRAECSVLDRMIGCVRAGESRSLVVSGEPGVGKTALLEYVATQSVGCQVVRGSGVQSEMELPFAGLHQLCAPLLGRLDRLPAPQREAVGTAFGIHAGAAPDKFLVGLAVLGLFAEAAHERPLMCLVDDHQWLDEASAQVLALVARRLDAESVGLVFVTREVPPDLAELAGLVVGGLRAADAAVLLDTVLTGPVDARVKDQLIAETQGNPLALIELPRGLTPAQLAGGFGLPGAVPLSGSIEESFSRRASALPEPTRRLLLIAASDAAGDLALVWRAAGTLGIGPEAVMPGVEAGLVELNARVRFRHPLARSAIYRAASAAERQQAHHVLAEATDPDLHPDRRAWHRAQAASGPDESVAVELERSADRARTRGGLAAAAAFLERSATFTLDQAQRAGRALAAAEAQLRAGAFDVAIDLLAMAEAGPLTEFQSAQVDRIRAQLAFVTNRGNGAAPLLLRAAERFGPIDPALARATYLDALSTAFFSARPDGAQGRVADVVRAVSAAPPAPGRPRSLDLLLDGTIAMLGHGYAAGLPALREALADFSAGLTAEEELHWLWLGSITAMTLCDDGSWDELTDRHVKLARSTGALSALPLALTLRALCSVFSGDLAAAGTATTEAHALAEATRTHIARYGELGLAAVRGEHTSAFALFQETIEDVTLRGEGIGITMAEWARALLCNSLGRYEDALAAALGSVGDGHGASSLVLPCVELVEAAVRSGRPEIGLSAYERLVQVTEVSRTDWALGLQARSKALLSEGAEAEDSYRESLLRFSRTRLKVDLARVHLLYGEWLRRERRRNEAGEQLRTAHNLFEAMGAGAFAARAGRELRAVGGSVRKRVEPTPRRELTAQETQIARLARDGLSNPEIAGRLFISPHTVQYHLRKVFAKLGVTARSQLQRVLPDDHRLHS